MAIMEQHHAETDAGADVAADVEVDVAAEIEAGDCWRLHNQYQEELVVVVD
jgi:hypothetical protein